MALAAICLGFVMITLDATIVNVALPAIRASVGGSVTGSQWVVDAYTIVLAALLLSAGSAADRLGARRLFVVGLAVFTVGSAACAAAPTEVALVVTRAVQGAGAAALLPASLALIVHQFPDRARRMRALGIWGGMSGLGLAAGPVLGGLAVGLVGWRAIFVVNVPVALLAVGLTRRAVAESPHRRGAAFDLPGQLLSAAALAALVAGFIEAGPLGWTAPATLVLFGAGLAAGVAFVVVEGRRTSPMLPLAVFRSVPFRGGVLFGVLFNFTLYGVLFCLSLYLEQTLGYSALAAGAILLPLTVAIGGNALASGRLTARLGSRVPMTIGATAGLVGAVLFALLGTGGPLALLVVGSLVFGCSAQAMPAMTSLTMHALPASQAGLGSGVLNAARQTGGALGVAVLGSLLSGPSTGTGGAVTLHLAMAVAAVGYLGMAALAVTTAGRTRPPLS